MPSKIESSLSPEQFWEFCDAVARLKGGRKGATLKEIQRLAAEWEIGYISTNSAKAFRDGAFQEFLDDLKADRDLAEHIAGAAKAGLNLDDAASKVLEQKLFKTALQLGDNVDPMAADFLTKSVERIRTSNRNARRLEVDLQMASKKIDIAEQRARTEKERADKLERERAEWERKQREVVAQLDRAKGAKGKDADEVRAAAVLAIDEIMGIAPKK